MRVNPISVCESRYLNLRKTGRPAYVNNLQVNFKKGHECAKFFGGTFGLIGAMCAAGASVILNGEVIIQTVLSYTLASTLGGAILGHKIDKDVDDNDHKRKYNKRA